MEYVRRKILRTEHLERGEEGQWQFVDAIRENIQAVDAIEEDLE